MSYLFLGRSGSSTLVVSDSRTSLVCDGYGCPHLQGFVALSAIILSRLSKHFWKPRGTHKSQSRFAVVKAIDVCGISASSHVDSRSVIIAWHKEDRWRTSSESAFKKRMQRQRQTKPY